MSLFPPSLACGLGLGGLFTTPELAAAYLLLQLSGNGSGGEDVEALYSSSSTSLAASSPPRSVSTCAAAAAGQQEEEDVEEFMGLGRRARKRYRLLSELYGATAPVKRAAAARKRKSAEDRPDAATMMWYREY